MIDLHVANGDAAVFLGAEPRFSIVDALENTQRLDEAFFKSLIVAHQVRRRSAGVVRPRDADARGRPARSGRCSSSPSGTTATSCSTCPRSDAAVLDALERSRASSSSRTRSWRRCAAPAASRRRCGSATARTRSRSSSAAPIALAEIGHEDVERAVGAPVKHSFPSDYRRALQALNKGTPVTVENHNELAGSLHEVRARAGRHREGAEGKEARRAVQPVRIAQGFIGGVQVMTSLFGAPTLQQSRGRAVPRLPGAEGPHPQGAAQPAEPRAARRRCKREDAEPEIQGLIVGLLERESQTTPLSLFEREALITDVLHELFGLGPLEALLQRSRRSRTSWSTATTRSTSSAKGKLEETDIVFKDDAHLLQIIERIVSLVGRRIDESSPMVDARLRTARASTRSSRRWRSTARCCRSAASAPTGSAPQDLVERASR